MSDLVPDQDEWDLAHRTALAIAWQAGYLRGTLDATSDIEPADNPYLDP